MRLSSEFLVVGAGAAGSAFGWLMRQAGHDVLAAELRSAQAKEKLCGGILGITALAELERIYGAGALDELGLTYPPHLLARSCDRQRSTPIRFATIERKALDDWLLARYLSAGGALRDAVKLVAVDEKRHVATFADLRTRGQLEISYGTLVGADGASSAVRRLCTGGRQRLVAALEGAAPLVGDDIIFSYRPSSQGYCWYIPAGQAANVGCMSYNEDVCACRAWLASFCCELGIEVPSAKGAPIPTGDDVLLEAGADIWLAGDAAGLASPIDGEGIHYALSSARLLAASLAGGTPYGEALSALSGYMAGLSAKRADSFLATNLLILRKGTAF